MRVWRLFKALIFLPMLVLLILFVWFCFGIWTAMDRVLSIFQEFLNKTLDESFLD